MKSNSQNILENALIAAANDPSLTEKRVFQKRLNEMYSGTWVAGTPPFFLILKAYKSLLASWIIEDSPRMRRLLRRRAVRSLSGISVISLLTKPWSCPGKCVYCPTNPWLPKSYIPNEPAVMRAEMNAFDPTRQVSNRLRALEITGHAPEKCDVRIIGGTWSAYPMEYRESFMREIYDAHTNFELLSERLESDELAWLIHPETSTVSTGKFAAFRIPSDFSPVISSSLEEAQLRNSTAKNRVIGIAIETRPDMIDEEEIRSLRRFWVTRVELGYQTTFDEINEATGRGHGNADAIRATKLLKNAGFKVVCHMMPGLPGSTPEMDRESFARVWNDLDFRPDEVKIYPAMVVANSELLRMYERGEFVPYSDEILVPLMAELQAMLPRWVRLNRSYRDIPASEIVAGSKKANLRQLTEEAMKVRGWSMSDISSREVRASQVDPGNAILRETVYEASEGTEYYLEYSDLATDTLFGHLRLRIPDAFPAHIGDSCEYNAILPELSDLALIREVHVFGDQLGIGETFTEASQHRGIGKLLLERAESIVRTQYPELHGIAVISGVGTWEYYRKFGYEVGDLGYGVKGW